MSKKDILDRIEINPKVCHGKPVIRNTRIPVALILGFLAAPQSFEEILSEYPGLTREDIIAAIGFGSYLAGFESLTYENLAQ